MGNPIMGDDAVAIRVLEQLEEKLHKLPAECIFAEDDMYFFINSIEKEDFLFILDATVKEESPGNIDIYNLKELYSLGFKDMDTQHGLSFLQFMKLYDKECEGYLITIEICNALPDSELSKEVKKVFNSICHKVFESINELY